MTELNNKWVNLEQQSENKTNQSFLQINVS